MALHEDYEGNFSRPIITKQSLVSENKADRRRFLKAQLRDLGFKEARVRNGSDWMSFRYRNLVVRVKIGHTFLTDESRLHVVICQTPQTKKEKELFEELYEIWERPSYMYWVDQQTKTAVRLCAAFGHIAFELKSKISSSQPDDSRKVLVRQIEFFANDYANQHGRLYQ